MANFDCFDRENKKSLSNPTTSGLTDLIMTSLAAVSAVSHLSIGTQYCSYGIGHKEKYQNSGTLPVQRFSSARSQSFVEAVSSNCEGLLGQ